MQIGSLTIQIKWVVLGSAVILGFIFLKIWLRQSETKEVEKKTFDLVSNSLFWGFIIWKFSLVLIEPKLVVKSPLSLLYFTGGEQGFIFGIVVAYVYYFFKANKEKISSDASFLYSYSVLGCYHLLSLALMKENLLFHTVLGLLSFLLLLFFKKMFLTRKSFFAISLVGIFLLGMFNPAVTSLPAMDATASGKIGINEGNLAPEIHLENLDGKEVKLSDFRGKKVILNFWASWCPPCKAEMPHMEDFFIEQQGNGIEIVSVNLTSSEKNPDKVKKFVKDYGLTFPVLLDQDGAVSDQYQAITIPTSYVIDSKGVIQKKIVGPMDKNMMGELIKKIK